MSLVHCEGSDFCTDTMRILGTIVNLHGVRIMIKGHQIKFNVEGYDMGKEKCGKESKN